MLWKRRHPEDPGDVRLDIADIFRNVRQRDYQDGLVDGMAIVLRLALGEATAGTDPYTGMLDPEFECWARDALARLTETNVTS